jgi:predicted transcriptional regulator
VQPDPDSPAAPVTSDSDAQFAAAVTAVTSAFGDPTRREIYLFVRSNPGATATEVAARFSLHPNVARHHLERLAAVGRPNASGPSVPTPPSTC